MSTLLDLSELAAYRGKRSESIDIDRGCSPDGQMQDWPREQTVSKENMASLHPRGPQA